MKKLLSAVCAAAIFAVSCLSAGATYQWTPVMVEEFTIYEDFEGESPRPINGKDGVWSKSGNQAPQYYEGVLHMLSVAGDSKDTSVLRKFDALTGKVAIDFNLRLNEGGYFGIYTLNSTQKASSRLQATVSNGRPILQMQAGKDDGAAQSAKYTLIDGMEYGRWYSVSMIYDLGAQRVDYYIDNELLYSDVRYFNNLVLDNIGVLQIYAQHTDTTTKYDISELKIGAVTDVLAMHYDSYNSAPSGLDNVKNDIELPSTGKYGSSISWSSSNESVISSDGKVNVANASGGDDGEVVILTAEYELNGTTYTRDFDATVYAVDEETELFYDDFTEERNVSVVANKDANAIVEKTVVDGRTVLRMNKQEGSAGEVKVSGNIDINASKKAIVEMEFKTEAQGANLLFVQERDSGRSIGRLIQKGGNLTWRGAEDAFITGKLDSDWHNVKVLVDTAAQNVCIYFDNMLVANDIGIMTNAVGNDLLGYITVFDPAQAIHYGDLYIDYVRIYEPKNQEIADLVANSITIPESTKGDVELPTVGSWGAEIIWESYDEDYILSDGTVVSHPDEESYMAELEATVVYGMGTSYATRFIDILPVKEIEYSYTVTDENGNNVTSIANVNEVQLKLNMNINTDDALDMFIGVAAYDEDGMLVAVDTDRAVLTGRDNVLTGTIDLSDIDASCVKCYIWEKQTPFVTIVPIR